MLLGELRSGLRRRHGSGGDLLDRSRLSIEHRSETVEVVALSRDVLHAINVLLRGAGDSLPQNLDRHAEHRSDLPEAVDRGRERPRRRLPPNDLGVSRDIDAHVVAGQPKLPLVRLADDRLPLVDLAIFAGLGRGERLRGEVDELACQLVDGVCDSVAA